MLKTCRQMILDVKFDVMYSVELATLDSNIENRIIEALDDAQDRVTDEILVTDKSMLSTYYDLTLDGSESYYLPNLAVKFDYENILMVEDTTTSTDSPVATTFTYWGDRLFYKANDTYGLIWNIRDNYIEFPNKPSGGTARIWHVRRPTGFFYCTADIGSTTTAVLPETMTGGQLVLEDDWYIGMKACTNNQITRITDYDASTRTLTFDAQDTAVDSSTVVDLVSPLPQHYVSRIINMASRRMLIGQRDNDIPLARFDSEQGSLMKNRLSHRTSQAPRGIRKS